MSIKTPLLIGITGLGVVALAILGAVHSLKYSIASVTRAGSYLKIAIFVDNPLDRVFLQSEIFGNLFINGKIAGKLSDSTPQCVQALTRTVLYYTIPLSLSYNPSDDFSIIQGTAGISSKIMLCGSVVVGWNRIPMTLTYEAI